MTITPAEIPQEHGFKPGDHHIVINAATKTAKCYTYDDEVLWTLPALCWGQHGDWTLQGGDTPPGLYKIGDIYDDYGEYLETPGYPPYSRTLASYGWCSFDMVDLEGNEDGNGRAGIMIHGGGSALGWPSAWDRHQELLPTLGCVRMHNQDLRDRLLPLTKQGTVFISVIQ